MFEVRSNSPMDDAWQERDDAIEAAAGRSSDFSGADVGINQCAGRDHGWNVETIEEAKAMVGRLNAVPLVKAAFREH